MEKRQVDRADGTAVSPSTYSELGAVLPRDFAAADDIEPNVATVSSTSTADPDVESMNGGRGASDFPTCIELPPCPREIFAVAFNPADERMVVFASNDGEVHVYSIAPRSLCASGPASLLHVLLGE